MILWLRMVLMVETCLMRKEEYERTLGDIGLAEEWTYQPVSSPLHDSARVA